MRLIRQWFFRPIRFSVAQKATGSPRHRARKQRANGANAPLK